MDDVWGEGVGVGGPVSLIPTHYTLAETTLLLDEAERLELSHEITHWETKLKEGRIYDVQKQEETVNSVKTFATGIAIVFSSTLTPQHMTGAQFVNFFLAMIFVLAVSYAIKNFLLFQRKYIVAKIAQFIYEVFVDTLDFFILLFTYIFLTSIRTFFNLTLPDTPFVVVAYLFYSLFSKIYAYFIQHKRFTI